MKYKKNQYFFENIKVTNIARKFGTPIYCYSYNKLKKNITNFKNNFKSFSPLICFAVKSNPNLNLIREIRKLGCGADVVSIGELMTAIKAGISPRKIVFSGVGKTSQEIKYAINKKVFLINAESESEILEIEKLAKLEKKIINIGIRLNPNIDAKTLNQISTGKKENKFGVDEKTFYKLVKYCKSSSNINLKCLSVHIGSQILHHKPYQKMLNIVNKVIKKSKFNFEFVDLGGGMGIKYEDKNKNLNYKKYNYAVNNFLKNNKCKIIFEPGRSIVGDIGILISKITYIKSSHHKNFIILDAGMNDLMRPALYGATHKIFSASKNNKILKKTVEFVGPICESTDKFLTTKNFQKLKEKDLVIISNTGAYGMSLFSNYNVRTRPAELLIKGSKIKILRPRQKLSDLI